MEKEKFVLNLFFKILIVNKKHDILIAITFVGTGSFLQTTFKGYSASRRSNLSRNLLDRIKRPRLRVAEKIWVGTDNIRMI